MSRSPRPEIIEKERKVLELKLAGITFDRIAEQVGYTDGSAACKAYNRAMKRTLQEPAQELREAELLRLDKILSGCWRDAISGDARAAATALKVIQERAKLLGLYAPIKTETEITAYMGGTEIDREVERLAELINSKGFTTMVANPISERQPSTTN
jgi:hypothetical protein